MWNIALAFGQAYADSNYLNEGLTIMGLAKLEESLNELLNKKAPFKIPADGRKGLANAFWIIALVFGILQLLLAYSFWHSGHVIDRAVDYVNAVTGYIAPVQHLGFFYYLSVLSMAVVAVLLLAATPGLKAMKKSGWDLLFYSILFEAVVAVVRLFSSVNGGIPGFVGSAISALIGGYLIFQVRDNFMGKAATSGRKVEHADTKK